MNTTPTPASASDTPRTDECPYCTNGIVRTLGRDNDEIIEDCPKCAPSAVAVMCRRLSSEYSGVASGLFLSAAGEIENLRVNLTAAQTENASLKVQLSAWHALFKTSQLTHAIAAKETLLAENARLRALLAEAQKDGAHAEQLQKIVNDLVCAGWYNVHIGGLAHRTTINSETLDRLRALYRPAAMAATPQLPAVDATTEGKP